MTRLSLSVLLARQWKTILASSFAGAVLLFLCSWLLPVGYEATATVLPPERQGMGGMLAFLSNSPVGDLLKGDVGGGNPATDLFKSIIDSRSVAEEVAEEPRIHSFLMRLDTNSKGHSELLRDALQTEAVRTGVFTVSVTLKGRRFASSADLDSTRVMAAYVANRFVAALDRFNRDRLMTSARNTRIFLEAEYAKGMLKLDSAYKALQEFQDAHQAISLPEQLSATVSAAAKLTAQIQQIETAISVEEHDLGPGSSTIKLLTAQLEAAKSQLAKYDEGGAGEYILALKSAPELARQLAHYLRETKVNEQLTAYLRTELEQQRISEQRDLPSLQVLDPAQPPTQPSSPNRKLLAALGLIFGLLGAVLYVLISNFIEDVRQHPEAHYRFVNFSRSIRMGKNAQLLAPPNPGLNIEEPRQALSEAWRP